MWTCGGPLFWNSTANVYAATGPKSSFLTTSLHKYSNLLWKILETKSGLFCTSSCGFSSAFISGQFGLQFLVKNESGLPYLPTSAIASRYRLRISLPNVARLYKVQDHRGGSNKETTTLSIFLVMFLGKFEYISLFGLVK